MAMKRRSGPDTLFAGAGAGNMISGNLQHRPPKLPPPSPPPRSMLEPVVREKVAFCIIWFTLIVKSSSATTTATITASSSPTPISTSVPLERDGIYFRGMGKAFTAKVDGREATFSPDRNSVMLHMNSTKQYM